MFGRRKQLERRRPLRSQTDRTVSPQYYRGQSTAPKEQGKRQSRLPEQKQPNKLKPHINRLPAYLSILAIVASLVYCSILGNSVAVILPSETLYAKTYYEDQAGEALNSSVFNHSKLTLDIRSLKADIQSRIPEVAEATISIPLVGQKPVIGLTMVPAKYLFTMPGNKAYIVGSNGRILADARKLDASKREGLMLLQEDVPLKVEVGQAVLSAGDIKFIEIIRNELKNANIEVAQLQLPLGAGELHVHLKSDSYIIKFAFNGDARQQAGAYLAVKKELGSQVPTSYIDVRIGERVFVR